MVDDDEAEELVVALDEEEDNVEDTAAVSDDDADWELGTMDVENVEGTEVALEKSDKVGLTEEELRDCEEDTEDDDCKDPEFVLDRDADVDIAELPEVVVRLEGSDCTDELKLEDPVVALAADPEEPPELDSAKAESIEFDVTIELDPEVALELDARVALLLSDPEVEVKLDDEAALELDNAELRLELNNPEVTVEVNETEVTLKLDDPERVVVV